MDDWERFLDMIALDESGVINQILSLSSIFNMIVSAIFGLLILFVYIKTNKERVEEKTFFITIPIISILMTLLMRMQGGNIAIFFGIFGVLSIVRFRSSTPLRDIPYILFAVINGVIIGIGNYLLAFLGFIIISLLIIIISFVFNKLYKKKYTPAVFKFAGGLSEMKVLIENFLEKNDLKYRLSNISAVYNANRKDGPSDSNTLIYEINYNTDDEFVKIHELLNKFAKEKDIRLELKVAV